MNIDSIIIFLLLIFSLGLEGLFEFPLINYFLRNALLGSNVELVGVHGFLSAVFGANGVDGPQSLRFGERALETGGGAEAVHMGNVVCEAGEVVGGNA